MASNIQLPNMTKADPSVPCAAYNLMRPNWDLVSALLGGTKAMREAGTQYLPKEPGETEPAYQNRLNRTTLFNGFKRTIQNYVGKPFAKEIEIGQDVPQRIQPWLENVDMAGRSLNTFARDLFTTALGYGMCHILVDYPDLKGKKLSWGEEMQTGIRPYWVLVHPKDLIGWQSQVIGGVPVLTQARIREEIWEPDPTNPFIERKVVRIRVYEPGKFTVYQKVPHAGVQQADSGWIVVNEGLTSLGRIPLVTVYTNRVGFMNCEPPLLDLAWLNVEHWQSSSDQRHILHVARVPILFGKGWTDSSVMGEGGNNRIEIGPNRFLSTPDPQADLKYVEHTGAAINAGRDDIAAIEARMAIIGSQLMQKRTSGPATATEEQHDAEAEDSDLKAMARNLEVGLEQAVSLSGQWVGVPPNADGMHGSLTIYKGFSDMASSTDLDFLLKVQQGGMITGRTLLAEAQRRDVLSPSLDVDDELNAADQEAVSMAMRDMEQQVDKERQLAAVTPPTIQEVQQ